MPKSLGRRFSQTEPMCVTSIQIKKQGGQHSQDRLGSGLRVVRGGCLCLFVCSTIDGHLHGFLFSAGMNSAAKHILVLSSGSFQVPGSGELCGATCVDTAVTKPVSLVGGQPLSGETFRCCSRFSSRGSGTAFLLSF